MRTLILLAALASAAASRFAVAAPKPGDPMVISVGADVVWQVVNPEEARKAFVERGELRRDTQGVLDHWAAHGPRYRDHGVTAFEPYVKWMLLEPKEGVWDPAFYDAELAQFKQHGLKWVPFLIAGPAYATPPWFKESAESVFAVDLATGDASRDQSVWNPHLRPRVRAWLQRFFAHYEAKDMQAVLCGISGVFGESIFTAGGNAWTHLWDGQYPQHLGWWCGDEHARADFRAKMQAKYQTVDALNRAWQTERKSFAEVAPFVPDATHPNRARLDLIRWYMGAMTDYAEWWVKTTRELAPTVPILLCTGGGAQPELGANMSAQTKMVARYGAGMRITNEASDYASNFHLTRQIGSAARLYGTYFGYEPAGAVSEDGIVARVYNAVASGAWELFHYDNPPAGARGERYKRYLDLMRVRAPIVEVGVFWSRTSVDLGLAHGLGAAAQTCRNVCDVDYVDELMISDAALEQPRVFVWPAGPVAEPATAEAIRDSVGKGLTLVVPRGWKPRSPEGEPLFPAALTTQPSGLGTFSIPGMPDDRALSSLWREGKFHGAEPDSLWHTPGRVCWTSGTATLHVPRLDKPAQIRVPYRVGSVAKPVRLVVDGKLVQQAAPGEVGELVAALPSAAAGDEWTAVTVEATTWQPAATGESSDTRALSVMLRDLIVEVAGAETATIADPVARVHQVGTGHVVEAGDNTPTGLARALTAILKEPGRYGVPPVSPETQLDCELDQLYVTVTTTDVLFYNHGDTERQVETRAGRVSVPGHAIMSVAR